MKDTNLLKAQIKSINSTIKIIEKMNFSETKVWPLRKKNLQKMRQFYSEIISDPWVRIDATKPHSTTN